MAYVLDEVSYIYFQARVPYVDNILTKQFGCIYKYRDQSDSIYNKVFLNFYGSLPCITFPRRLRTPLTLRNTVQLVLQILLEAGQKSIHLGFEAMSAIRPGES